VTKTILINKKKIDRNQLPQKGNSVLKKITDIEEQQLGHCPSASSIKKYKIVYPSVRGPMINSRRP